MPARRLRLSDEARDELHELLDQAVDRAPHLAGALRHVLGSVSPDQQVTAVALVDGGEAILQLLTSLHRLGDRR